MTVALVLLDLDPNVVKPGWTPLLITIGLAAVMVLGFFSLRKQFRRIDVSQSQPGVSDPAADPETVAREAAGRGTAAPGGGAPVVAAPERDPEA